MRRSLATELLENTHMSIDQVAERIGFADATSFRKAFKKWTEPLADRLPPSGAEPARLHRCPRAERTVCDTSMTDSAARQRHHLSKAHLIRIEPGQEQDARKSSEATAVHLQLLQKRSSDVLLHVLQMSAAAILPDA